MVGASHWRDDIVRTAMVGVPFPFGADDEGIFDAYDEFVPRNVPLPGAFLDGHDVLTGRPHLAFHRLTRDLFEECAVYDVTFGYNLARLNCDSRHTDAGYRYAVEDPDAGGRDGEGNEGKDGADGRDGADPPLSGAERRVLRAEFTPTTPFCPQSDTLTVGSFRAWHGPADRHEFDLVRVRVSPMHQRSAVINERLRALEDEFRENGELPGSDGGGSSGSGPSHQDRARAAGRDGSRAPF